MISTVIFDMDGLLADSEKLHYLAYRDTLLGHGLELSPEIYDELWIRAGKGLRAYLAQIDRSILIPRIRREKKRRFKELIATSLEPMPGALELVRSLHGQKTLALASSSYHYAVDAILNAFGIRSLFSTTVWREHVANLKPAPDIFLRAADDLGVSPSQCLVLEDAEKGVIAAAEAGMRCIAIPTEITKDHDFGRATMVLPSLTEVTLELIDTLPDR